MDYFPIPEEFELDPSRTVDAASRTVTSAYGRYVQGVKAVIDSFDIPVGLTPKEKVWQLNKATLYRYTPIKPASELYPVPVLLVYALINKPFIFDLAPGRSFVEFMMEQGFDLYLLDWGAPGPEDQNTLFDDYVTEYLFRAVRKMQRVSGAREFSMLGYCIGATLATVFAAVFPEVPLRNLMLLTAPLDFTHQPEGSMAVWLSEGRLDVDKIVDGFGNIPGELIEYWAKMLKPMENFLGSYVNLWKQLDDTSAVRAWQAINRWVEDVIPFSGNAFRQFVDEYLRANELVTGKHVIKGKPVNLSAIRASLLNVVAKYDHLVAQSQSESIMEMVSSEDKELKVIPSTHVGLMVSRGARHKLWPEIVSWLSDRSG